MMINIGATEHENMEHNSTKQVHGAVDELPSGCKECVRSGEPLRLHVVEQVFMGAAYCKQPLTFIGAALLAALTTAASFALAVLLGRGLVWTYIIICTL
jgi:hypothetical protein